MIDKRTKETSLIIILLKQTNIFCPNDKFHVTLNDRLNSRDGIPAQRGSVRFTRGYLSCFGTARLQCTIRDFYIATGTGNVSYAFRFKQ